MKNKNGFNKNSKSWRNALSILGLSTLCIGSAAGIGVGAWQIAKNQTDGLGSDYGKPINLEIEISLKNRTNPATQMEEVQVAAEAFSAKLSELGIKQTRTTGSIAYKGNSNNTIDAYGIVNIQFEPNFQLNYKEPEDPDKGKDVGIQDNSKIQLFASITDSISLEVQDLTPFVHTQNINDPEVNPIPDLNLNDPDAVAFRSLFNGQKNTDLLVVPEKNIINAEISLLKDGIDKEWVLDGFQKQFTRVFEWNKTDENRKKTQAQAFDGSKLTQDSDSIIPKTIWLVWKNRSALVSRINYVMVVSFLQKTVSRIENISAETLDYVNELFKGIVGDSFDPKDEQTGLDLAKKNEWAAIAYYFQDIITDWNKLANLILSNEVLDYNYINSIGPRDPLINLLSGFYSSNRFWDMEKNNQSQGDGQSGSSPSSRETKKGFLPSNFDLNFLCSWNFGRAEIINQYAYTFDFANFFTSFKRINEDDLKYEDVPEDDPRFSEFKSNTYAIDLVAEFQRPDEYLSQKFVNLLKKSNTGSNFYIKDLSDIKTFIPSLNSTVGDSAKVDKLLKNSIEPLFNTLIFKTAPSLSHSSITNTSAYIGFLVGLLALILIIGIVVSVLYKFPGFISALMLTLTSVISIVSFKTLYANAATLSFSFDSTIGLFSGLFMGLISSLAFLHRFRSNAMNNNNNLNNSFINATKYWLKLSLGLYGATSILSLVFLYFGFYEIQGFGSMLVINVFISFLFNFVLFICSQALLIFGLDNKSDVIKSCFYNELATKLIKLNYMGSLSDNETFNSNSIIDKGINKIQYNKWYFWLIMSILGVIGLVGMIVLLTVGPGGSLVFGLDYNLIFPNSVSVNEIQSLLGVKFNSWHSDGTNIIASVSASSINTVYSNLDKIKNIDIEILKYNEYSYNQILKNLVETMAISMGFLLIWSFIWCNFISILNIFITQLLNILLFGLMGVFRITINIETIIMLCGLYYVQTMFIYWVFISLKTPYKMHESHDLNQINIYTKSTLILNTRPYLLFVILFISTNLVQLLFVSSDLLIAFSMFALIGLLSFIISICSVPLMFIWSMYVREKYMSQIKRSKTEISNKFDYDKIDEQEIIGINKFVKTS